MKPRYINKLCEVDACAFKLSIEKERGGVRGEAGEFFIVPRGVEHKPVAEEEAHILMFEPETTLNTGNVQSERTVEQPETI